MPLGDPVQMPSGETRYDYGDGLLAYQRPCTHGCDRGLIYSPVRFCVPCGGTGWQNRWVRVDAEGKEIEVSGPGEVLDDEDDSDPSDYDEYDPHDDD